jgi:hypothetical protein
MLMSTRSRFSEALIPALVLLACQVALAQPAGQEAAPLTRRYRDGERIAFHMTATNEDRVHKLAYSGDAIGIVGKDAADAWEEIFTWSNLVYDGAAVSLPDKGAPVSQKVSLASQYRWSPPDVAHTHPKLVGPTLDLMTFYIDLWLATKEGKLVHQGDRLRVPGKGANSWADGSYVTLGEDAIDFDVELSRLDEAAKTALVIVRHVPPEKPEIKLPAAWMKEPVGDTANNWVQVQKGEKGRFLAAVGRETFDVELTVSLADGRIVSATMDNIVDVLERECASAALDEPGEPRRYQIHRKIEIRPRG